MQPVAVAAGLAELAGRLGVPAAQEQEEMIAALWDRLRQQDRWLLVFDNVEEPAALERHRPPTGGGRVLTSPTPPGAGWPRQSP